jgi:hypothetical protein
LYVFFTKGEDALIPWEIFLQKWAFSKEIFQRWSELSPRYLKKRRWSEKREISPKISLFLSNRRRNLDTRGLHGAGEVNAEDSRPRWFEYRSKILKYKNVFFNFKLPSRVDISWNSFSVLNSLLGWSVILNLLNTC